jgi:HSP20 family molecular chaperone IbpA
MNLRLGSKYDGTPRRTVASESGFVTPEYEASSEGDDLCLALRVPGTRPGSVTVDVQGPDLVIEAAGRLGPRRSSPECRYHLRLRLGSSLDLHRTRVRVDRYAVRLLVPSTVSRTVAPTLLRVA